MSQRPIKLSGQQLRTLIAEELKRARLVEAGEFELTDTAQTIMDNPDVSAAAAELIEQLAHFADKLAKKEELVPADGDAFYDECLEQADARVRDCVYAYIERMLQRATGY